MKNIGTGSLNNHLSESPLYKLVDFCHCYDPEEIEELLCRLLAALVGGNYATLDSLAKERLLYYFEALGEVLPALHEILRHITASGRSEREDEIYRKLVGGRQLFATLKRHPE